MALCLRPLLALSRPSLGSLASRQLQTSALASSSPSPSPSSFEAALGSTAALPASVQLSHLAGPGSVAPSGETGLLAVLARLVMKSGKLPRAHAHVSLCLATLALTTASPPLPLLTRALDIVSPSIRIVGRRKGTKSLPTPQPLSAEQRRRQAWLWIVEASEKRSGQEKEFGKRLALEVMGVLSGQSEAIKKKEARHLQGVIGRANVGR